MEHPTVKQERLGEGETSSEMERLSQRLRELDMEIAREMEQAKSRTEERRSPATDRMWPGWVPQSTTTDTLSQARPRADQPDGARRAEQEESDATQSIASLTETVRDIVAIQQAMIEQCRPPQHPGPRLCWGYEQPGHIHAYCPQQAPQPKISWWEMKEDRGRRGNLGPGLQPQTKHQCTSHRGENQYQGTSPFELQGGGRALHHADRHWIHHHPGQTRHPSAGWPVQLG
ncbi:hypothetical protein EOD39_19847 [Acipenser ruthenus]|uniref:Uncharacterized protein n=1 Tax=Acipenser ruthenus TaxID=7906 RepID=A0A444UX08_ACIRT|nr:hypothetical protein EOD39_19847 [Acipenser ruthenus]